MLNLANELKSILASLRERNIPYALAGELVYSIWFEGRASEVNEILVLANDWDETFTELKSLGYEEVALTRELGPVEGHRLLKSDEEDVIVLDVLIATGAELELGIAERIELEFEGIPFQVAPPKTLLILSAQNLLVLDDIRTELLINRKANEQ